MPPGQRERGADADGQHAAMPRGAWVAPEQEGGDQEEGRHRQIGEVDVEQGRAPGTSSAATKMAGAFPP